MVTFALARALNGVISTVQGTELARATPGNIRPRLLKVGAQIRLSVRRVVVALSEAFPAHEIFIQAARNLAALPARAGPG